MITTEILNKRINDCIPAKAWESTVSIISFKDKILSQFGTGTLFRVAEQSFLVTAAHVVSGAYESDMGLCIPASNNSFVQIHGNWICSSEAPDIAILPLDLNVVEKLSDSSFLRLHDVCFNENLLNGIFCLFGYPEILAQPSTDANTSLVLKPFQYATYTYDGPTDALGSGYQERLHLLLGAKQSESTDINGSPCIFLDRKGNRRQFPGELGGISGCSVWMIGTRNNLMEKSDKERARIVGVQTSVYPKSQIIRATRWLAVSTLINEAFPELRPALALYG